MGHSSMEIDETPTNPLNSKILDSIAVKEYMTLEGQTYRVNYE